MANEAEILRRHGINPSAQRVAVAEYVLCAECHPSADAVWQQVRARFPMISRATVYNTLNLFVEKGLLRQMLLNENHVVFDPNIVDHHHFVDEETGEIHDIPWEALQVSDVARLPDFDVREYQVVLRGRRRSKVSSP